MNQYGTMARDHYRRYRPTGFRAIKDPTTFFHWLGLEIERRIDDRAALLEEMVPTDLPFQERLQQMTAARSEAERLVLAETLPAAEDDEMEKELS